MNAVKAKNGRRRTAGGGNVSAKRRIGVNGKPELLKKRVKSGSQFSLLVKTMSQSEKHAKPKSANIKTLNAVEFDHLADSGQDMSDYLD